MAGQALPGKGKSAFALTRTSTMLDRREAEKIPGEKRNFKNPAAPMFEKK
jgi:hypothetical protein